MFQISFSKCYNIPEPLFWVSYSRSNIWQQGRYLYCAHRALYQFPFNCFINYSHRVGSRNTLNFGTAFCFWRKKLFCFFILSETRSSTQRFISAFFYLSESQLGSLNCFCYRKNRKEVEGSKILTSKSMNTESEKYAVFSRICWCTVYKYFEIYKHKLIKVSLSSCG